MNAQKGFAHVLGLFLLITGIVATLILIKNPSIFKSKASGKSIREIINQIPGIPSVGANNYSLFWAYSGNWMTGKKYALHWRQQGGGSPGSEAVRYGPFNPNPIGNLTTDGNYALSILTKPAAGVSPLWVRSDPINLSPNTIYKLSAYIRNGDPSQMKVVVFNSGGSVIQNNSLDVPVNNWQFYLRTLSFTAPAQSSRGYVEFIYDTPKGRNGRMDIDQVSLTDNSGKNLLPNSSFEEADATESKVLAIKAMDDARASGINYLRVMVGGHCAYDYNQWRQDPNAYWQSFDQMMQDASSRGIRIIPLIVQFPRVFSYILNKSPNDVLTPGSQSNQLLKQYTRELVSRYKDNSNILFWDIASEMNIETDFDWERDLKTKQANGQYFAGSECFESPDGKNYTTDQMVTFINDMAEFIKGIDSNRLISAGYAMPRVQAWHLWKNREWIKDSSAQLEEYLQYINPSSVDLISVHPYRIKGQDWDIDTIATAASYINKPLFIGEFGDADENYTFYPDGAFSKSILDAVVIRRIPFAAIWDWERYESTYPPTLGVGSLAPGKYDNIITMIKDANKKLIQSSVVPSPSGSPTSTIRPVSAGVIFDDQLENSWLDWSWGTKTDLNNTSPAYSGSKSISATVGVWGAVSFAKRDGFDTTPYTHFKFYIQRGGIEDQNLSVKFSSDLGTTFGPQVKIGKVPSGNWLTVDIPLSSLGADHKTINKIAIGDAAGQSHPIFYIDNVEFH